MLPKNVIRYGNAEPLPERIPLQAGPLSLVYEAGDLRYLRLHDREILRRVYVAVRDRNWGTVPARLSNVRIDAGGDTFRITYDAENQQGEIDFRWQGTITGDASGTVTFSMDGIANSTFWRNRLGICVLHPMQECAGQACRVEHADGTLEQGAFPRLIAPHQPFQEIRAIEYEVMPGVRSEIRFSGDIFEMEDQRNWTDASFKTYSTPLRLPYPAGVAAGTHITQSITLTLKGDVPEASPVDRSAPISFVVGEGPGHLLPRIGLQLAGHGEGLSEQELARLRALNLSHLRAELQLSRPEYVEVLKQATAQARELGVDLELALFLSEAAGDELPALATLIEEVEPVVRTFWIFSTQEHTTLERYVELARDHLGGYAPATFFGGGTDASFVEINRDRPPISALDTVTYSITPQVHAFDNASLVENLATQAETVKSARAFCADLPLGVGPVMLKPRLNPDATTSGSEEIAGGLPPQVDPRQMSLFGAGWTAGSLKYLGESGVESLTYYETIGWRGVMETEPGSPAPELFPSFPGAVFPLYHVLADVGEFNGGHVVPATSSEPLAVDGLALHKDGRRRIILANYGDESRRVTVRNVGREARVRLLDDGNAEEAMLEPEAFREREGQVLAADGDLELELPPFAVARIDTGPS